MKKSKFSHLLWSGLRWLTPPPLTVSLTVKYPGFFYVPWYLSRCVHRSSFVFVDQMFLRIFLFVTSDVLTLLLIMFKYYFLQSLFRLFLLLQHCATLAIGRRPRPEAFAFYRRNTPLATQPPDQDTDMGNYNEDTLARHRTQETGCKHQTKDRGHRTKDAGHKTQGTGHRTQTQTTNFTSRFG